MTLRKLAVGIAVAVLIVDQFVKYWVTGPMGIDYPGAELPLLPFFTLRFVQNFGVSLGLLQAGSEFARWALVAMTAMSTALSLLALVLFGGEAIKGFSVVMLAGVVICTYSAIFVSTPFLIYIGLQAGGSRTQARDTSALPQAAE